MAAAHRARRWSFGGLVLVLTTALVAAVLLSTTGSGAAPARAAALAQNWSDDFDGPAGAGVDGGKWTMETGGSGNGNHELQYYTGGNSNAALDGQGHLVITAKKNSDPGLNCWYGTCQYTSARLNTSRSFTQAYGHFESRIKIPRGQGVWPAFWMLGSDIGSVGWPNSGEIDVMENIGREPSTVHGTIHGPGYSGAGGLGAAYSLPAGQSFADAFHVFAVDWSPTAITWSVDGHTYETRTPADVGGNHWAFDHPFFLILNLAIGGDWPGSPDGSTAFPQTMVVDYVHVSTSNTNPPSYTGRITGIGGMCVDVAGGSNADGTPIQLHNCTGNPAQQWTVGGDGTVRALGKCLDVSGGSHADGAVVQLYTCNGTPAQQWTYTSAHDLTNTGANKCLDAKDNSSADGTRLQIWTCGGGANQKWNLG
ncbi:ricin-type beta-trefoil lectin domain protein [Kitasatospora paracochleata]|uniref:Beta-glucanase (GH16 family) n=1 Tax=Kitasatospora paracochleata TaxID=58354 RepID=A0ABT1J8G8_9ACTN|nr:family 16 glycosylhydrolase [Kitasatospora paracochleata]MCP2313727.1 beta-glucanase (GH16 family) [Kitasatospora paracochleata]